MFDVIFVDRLASGTLMKRQSRTELIQLKCLISTEKKEKNKTHTPKWSKNENGKKGLEML